jgi:hypothetical protein
MKGLCKKLECAKTGREESGKIAVQSKPQLFMEIGDTHLSQRRIQRNQPAQTSGLEDNVFGAKHYPSPTRGMDRLSPGCPQVTTKG